MHNPITRQVKELIQDQCDEYYKAKQELNPTGYSAEEYYARSLVLAERARSYEAIVESLDVDAFESIFEEME